MFGASLPVADASDTSLRAGVEDNLARRLRATAMEAGVHTTQFTEDFKAIALGVILIPIIPWDTSSGITEEAGARWH